MIKLISGEELLNPRLDDIFLAAFLRARKHDVEKAFQCVSTTFTLLKLLGVCIQDRMILIPVTAVPSDSTCLLVK